MKILFVSLAPLEANASAVLRNNALIKGLLLNNNEVDILTIPKIEAFTDNNEVLSLYDSTEIFYIGNNKLYNSLVEHRDNLAGRLRKSLLPTIRYLYHRLSVYDNTIQIAKSAELDILPKSYYDIIISSSDPKSSHYAVNRLIKQGIRYGKWIQYWGDPMAADISNRSILPNSYIKRKETKLFSCADSIVYVSPLTLEEQQREFKYFANKMHFVPIAYSSRKESKIDKAYSKTRLGYFGDYSSRKRDIRPLYEAIRKEKTGYELVIAGNSDLKLEPKSHISIYPRITQKEVDERESKCDILVCILNIKGAQIPGKIYHYAATDKPILIIMDGEKKEQMREYFKRFNRYVMCENYEISILNAVNEIINMDRRFEPSPYFDPKNIAIQLLETVNN